MTPKIPQRRVVNQAAAGSVDVAVLSVTDWESYRDRLTPGFALSASDALDKVLPETARVDERVSDALALRAAVGLPTSIATETITETGDATTTEAQTQTSSGEPPTSLPTPYYQGDLARDLKDLPGFEKLVEGPLKGDPILQYQMATALLQIHRVDR